MPHSWQKSVQYYLNHSSYVLPQILNTPESPVNIFRRSFRRGIKPCETCGPTRKVNLIGQYYNDIINQKLTVVIQLYISFKIKNCCIVISKSYTLWCL